MTSDLTSDLSDYGTPAVVLLLLVREVRSMLVGMKKDGTDHHEQEINLLTELIEMHKDPTSMFATTGIEQRLANLERGQREVRDFVVEIKARQQNHE